MFVKRPPNRWLVIEGGKPYGPFSPIYLFPFFLSLFRPIGLIDEQKLPFFVLVFFIF